MLQKHEQKTPNRSGREYLRISMTLLVILSLFTASLITTSPVHAQDVIPTGTPAAADQPPLDPTEPLPTQEIQPTGEPTSLPEPTQDPTLQPEPTQETETPIEPTPEFTPTAEPTLTATPFPTETPENYEMEILDAMPVLEYWDDPSLSTSGLRTAVADSISIAANAYAITYAPSGSTDRWGYACSTFPDSAKPAVARAAALWASEVNSSVPITLRICWASMDAGKLGHAGGGSIARNFPGAPVSNVWYNAALANALSGTDLDPSNHDMHITLNRNMVWYTGTDAATPASQHDMVTVVMHEMGHGLGVTGSAIVSGTEGSYGYGTVTISPTIYDTFMQSESGKKLTSYNNPSVNLGSLLTSNSLWFAGPYAMGANGGSPVRIFAPSTWAPGSSYSHLDYNTYNGTINRMMVYRISSGSANHYPGPVTLGILKDIGWGITSSLVPAPGPDPQPAPAAAETIQPAGNIYTITPAYEWTVVPGASQYRYQVYRGDTLVFSKTVSGSSCTAASCKNKPDTKLVSGNTYNWQVQANVGGSWQPYNDPQNFKVIKPVPSTVLPAGNTYNRTPEYQWSEVDGAEQYQLQVYRGTTQVIFATLSNGFCVDGTCKYTPDTALNPGGHKWRVRAHAGGVWNAWTAYRSFKVINPVPNTLAPIGTLYITNPTYKWSKVTGATQYQLDVYQGDTLQSSTPVPSGACGSSTCQFKPAVALADGAYRWQVRAYAGGTWWGWSALRNFLVVNPVPRTIEPLNTISLRSPTYTWSRVAGATQYQYQVYRGSTLVFSRKVGSAVCGLDTCQETPVNLLAYTGYKWRVRAYIGGSWKSYSPFLSFSVAAGLE